MASKEALGIQPPTMDTSPGQKLSSSERNLDRAHSTFDSTITGLARSGGQKLKFLSPKTGPFGPLMARVKLSRCRDWILRFRELSVRGSRAPDDIWDPISGPSPQKCERFLNILKFATNNSKLMYFVWPGNQLRW